MFDTLIEAPELNANLFQADWIIIDCRYDLKDTGAGYRSYLNGHVPGAIYAHLHDDLSGPPDTDKGRHPLPAPKRLQEVFSRFGIDHRSQVVAYDDSYGAMAGRLWWMLRYMNHDAVAVLNGGWQAWVARGYDIEEDEAKSSKRCFEGSPRRKWLVTVDQIRECARIIDAREPARFRGEEESVDPVAGHIPGARNHYWKNNLDATGCFRPAHVLRQAFQMEYADVPPEQVTFYCGSGVSACHNVLAAVYAGLPFPRLYVGSWSEWCSDRSRPVSKGPA